ncbi:hypothetical protein QBZ16_000144 [Prototheca wickerhamii]|uniref:phosphoribosylformylglycinamidine synthase n=1 Tax=Prototheca wickerhamii TaxID=3111 RepID=A0AAD9IMC1_PROWI|nr:hypothetical protein QBZ16_000144 [Prototheca wickerhamii]
MDSRCAARAAGVATGHPALLLARGLPGQRASPSRASQPRLTTQGLSIVARPATLAARCALPRSRRAAPLRAVADAAAPSTRAEEALIASLLAAKPGTATLLREARRKAVPGLTALDTELCFNISLLAPLERAEARTLCWLLRETFEPEQLVASSRLSGTTVEVGPRMSFSTAWSANAVSICESVGLGAKIDRLEVSRRYQLSGACGAAERGAFAALVHDRMTEQVYERPLRSFATDATPGLGGRAALERVNAEMGLALDDWDLDYYTKMFGQELGRDPTNVELFDIAQSNSEHSRHWFFRGKLSVDGEPVPETLMQMVKSTLKASGPNSVLAFKDNSSAIRGREVATLLPETPGEPSPLRVTKRDLDLLLTAETHNFPCAVAPYPGAETGAGGRIRDTHATGIGSLMGAATAGYCVGNLHLEGYEQAHDDASLAYPDSLAHPRTILTDASNGASDYGNKFGEPLVAGFTRSFGQRLPSGERREWIKPIISTTRTSEKAPPALGMLVVKIGGPAYRIGMGGGAASSVPSGSNSAELDFNAVQRGDAEVSQKLWRVVRACVELGDANPIQQIHDQGAGGNCNVVKEIIYPLGAEINIRGVHLGDATMSVLEIWGAEYQENDCLLIKPEDRALLEGICRRERCDMCVIGAIDGSGRVRVVDPLAPAGGPTPVDLDFEAVLGDMPDKSFDFVTASSDAWRRELEFGTNVTPAAALDRVLRLPSVCSKRFLTNKVDRCVTGLVAQQQCVGPLHTPLADVAVLAQSHYDTTGAATSIGEAPIKGLLSPAAMARLAVGEALTNLVFAPITSLEDVKSSVNWMYAAKMAGEGAAMVEAGRAMRDAMAVLGVGIDGGKDSLSMAAAAGGETVMAPGNLVVSAYVGCPDVTAVVTPDLKLAGGSALVHVDLGAGRRRLGASALAQAYSQIGAEVPDVDPAQLRAAFEATQALIKAQAAGGPRRVLAGHDVSDGGLVVAALEMAFAGDCGLDLAVPACAEGALAALFAEELGLVLEVPEAEVEAVLAAYAAAGVPAAVIGQTRPKSAGIRVSVGDQASVIAGAVADLRDAWEETSWELELRQANEATVAQERAALREAEAPRWSLPYRPVWTDAALLAERPGKVRVAVIREEGTNGDREMAAAVQLAGMEAWDVTMSDLLSGAASLDAFQGIIFPGGFSYADVLDSAKGWAATIRFNDRLLGQFQAFYERPDTFSLGVCNGCQLMALLGWVPGTGQATPTLPDAEQPRFTHNESGRFECRWSTVEIDPDSPAVLLRGMGGARMGVWVAHGEGRALFPSQAVKDDVLKRHLAPIRYVTPTGEHATQYPYNPNGSADAVAALCSPDGRHLALMPHPERCLQMWQNPWWPEDTGLQASDPSPWLKLFQNAREWADSVRA